MTNSWKILFHLYPYPWIILKKISNIVFSSVSFQHMCVKYKIPLILSQQKKLVINKNLKSFNVQISPVVFFLIVQSGLK